MYSTTSSLPLKGSSAHVQIVKIRMVNAPGQQVCCLHASHWCNTMNMSRSTSLCFMQETLRAFFLLQASLDHLDHVMVLTSRAMHWTQARQHMHRHMHDTCTTGQHWTQARQDKHLQLKLAMTITHHRSCHGTPHPEPCSLQ